MNVLLDDLVNELVHQVQAKVGPALEHVAAKTTARMAHTARTRIPTSTDLLYLTDRLIVSSAPALAWPTPVYADLGRDERIPWPRDRDRDRDRDNNNNNNTMEGEAGAEEEEHQPKSLNDSSTRLQGPPDEELSQVLESASVEESSLPSSSHHTLATNTSPGTSATTTATTAPVLVEEDVNEEEGESPLTTATTATTTTTTTTTTTENPQDGTSMATENDVNDVNEDERDTRSPIAEGDTTISETTSTPLPDDESMSVDPKNAATEGVTTATTTTTTTTSTSTSTPPQQEHTSIAAEMPVTSNERELRNDTADDDDSTQAPQHKQDDTVLSGDGDAPNQNVDSTTACDSAPSSSEGGTARQDVEMGDSSEPALPPATLLNDPTVSMTNKNDDHFISDQRTDNDDVPVVSDDELGDDEEEQDDVDENGMDKAAMEIHETNPGPAGIIDPPPMDEDEHDVGMTMDPEEKAIEESTLISGKESPSPPLPTTAEDANDVDMKVEPGESTEDTTTSVKEPQHPPPPPASALRNSPATIATYLEKRHGKHRYLAFSLTDDRPDDRTLLLFRRQIVQLGWWSPCMERSETPSISKLLKACYSIHAYLQLNPSNVALIYCANGKTRTAIVLACYLKYSGLVATSREGFLHFLTERGIPNPVATWNSLPPSLQLFFRQFDTTLELGGFLNRKPLLLRAIALQGIPVEDKPCLDIWDSSQRHVYSSHPEMWHPQAPIRQRMMGPSQHQEKRQRPSHLSQWADEEGFYKVNVVLEGDFLLLCRFGGDFAKETNIHDPSKVLFRYANTTGFLTGGYPYELPPEQVDLSRRYSAHLDDDDFLVTLLFEANWERLGGEAGCEDGEPTLPKELVDRLQTSSDIAGERIFRGHDPEACEEGWRIILQHHSARPDKSDIAMFQQMYRDEGMDRCKDHLVCIALQLTNFDYQETKKLLLKSPSFSWWQHPLPSNSVNTIDKVGHGADKAADEILGLLDEINVEQILESPDLQQVQLFTSNLQGPQSMRKRPYQSGQRSPAQSRQSHEVADPSLRSSGWMVSSVIYPRQGDILGSFASRHDQVHASSMRNKAHPSVFSRTMPQLPYFPRDKPALLPPSSKRVCRETQHHNVEEVMDFPRYDPLRGVAEHLHLELQHTGVTLPGLMELVTVFSTLADTPVLIDESDEEVENMEEDDELAACSSHEASMNREAKEQQQKKWEEAQKAETEDKEKQKAEEARKKEEEEAKRKKDSTPDKDGDDTPLKDDPEYAKYFKMLKMGMPKEQVLHAMTRDEKDQSVLEFDPERSLKSQRPEKQTGGDISLHDDPEYSKYFKMLNMGLPMGAVKNAMTRDEKDPSVMDLDPNKSLKSQKPDGDADADDAPPLREDPEFTKYFKMLKMGLPIGAVKNALTKDGKDPGIMDLDPDRSFKSQSGGSGDADSGTPLEDDPEYEKYFKMLGMGLPIGAVKNALTRDGKDPGILDLDPTKSIKSQTAGAPVEEDSGPPLKDDTEYAKYFKMLGMGLPLGAVKNAISRDGKDPAIMDLDPNKSMKSQLGGAEEKDTGVPLKDDPEYSKYFKMMSMGLPPGAVKNAIERDGKDPAVLDMDHTKSVAFQLKKKSVDNKKATKKKKRVRRKKIYWNPIDPSKIKEDSMWNIVRGSIAMDKLTYDQKEFEDLFTESADPSDQKNKKTEKKKEAKKLVQVIDPKRSMNGGIVLARLKTDHSKVAEFVTRMDHGKFDSTQLNALNEYLPDADERRGLIVYMKKGEKSKEIHDKLFADCSETEKYMVTMLEVSDAGPKLDAMLFRTTFKNRFEETTEAIRILNSACDELRSSEKLRKLMAVILTVVNQINTGGEGKMAMGFTLDALLKLNEAKAFDKQTSVLHYVVKLVKKNDGSLLVFESDLRSVIPAESVLLDGLVGEVKTIGEELTGVHETVKDEAGRLENAGELKPMSLSDLAEQRTSPHLVDGVAQFNKVNHLTGRTAMERFTLNAKVACDQATASINNVKQKYTAILSYFGEDEQMLTGDFFGTLRRFIAEWKKAVEQVEAIDTKEAKERKRAEVRAKKAAAKANGKKVEKSSSQPKKGSGGAAAATATAAALSKKKRESAAETIIRNENTVSGRNPAVGAATTMSSLPISQNGGREELQPPGGVPTFAGVAARRKNQKTPGGVSQVGNLSLKEGSPLNTPANRRSWDVENERSLAKSKSRPARNTWEKTHNKGSNTPDYSGAVPRFHGRSSENAVYNATGEPTNAPQAIQNETPRATNSEAATSFQSRKFVGAVYGEDGKPLPSPSSHDIKEAMPKSHFASKAAAYRQRKEKKDDVDDGKTRFSSAAAAYRRRKSQKDVGLEESEENTFGHVSSDHPVDLKATARPGVEATTLGENSQPSKTTNSSYSTQSSSVAASLTLRSLFNEASQDADSFSVMRSNRESEQKHDEARALFPIDKRPRDKFDPMASLQDTVTLEATDSAEVGQTYSPPAEPQTAGKGYENTVVDVEDSIHESGGNGVRGEPVDFLQAEEMADVADVNCEPQEANSVSVMKSAEASKSMAPELSSATELDQPVSFSGGSKAAEEKYESEPVVVDGSTGTSARKGVPGEAIPVESVSDSQGDERRPNPWNAVVKINDKLDSVSANETEDGTSDMFKAELTVAASSEEASCVTATQKSRTRVADSQTKQAIMKGANDKNEDQLLRDSESIEGITGTRVEFELYHNPRPASTSSAGRLAMSTPSRGDATASDNEARISDNALSTLDGSQTVQRQGDMIKKQSGSIASQVSKQTDAIAVDDEPQNASLAVEKSSGPVEAKLVSAALQSATEADGEENETDGEEYAFKALENIPQVSTSLEKDDLTFTLEGTTITESMKIETAEAIPDAIPVLEAEIPILLPRAQAANHTSQHMGVESAHGIKETVPTEDIHYQDEPAGFMEMSLSQAMSGLTSGAAHEMGGIQRASSDTADGSVRTDTIDAPPASPKRLSEGIQDQTLPQHKRTVDGNAPTLDHHSAVHTEARTVSKTLELGNHLEDVGSKPSTKAPSEKPMQSLSSHENNGLKMETANAIYKEMKGPENEVPISRNGNSDDVFHEARSDQSVDGEGILQDTEQEHTSTVSHDFKTPAPSRSRMDQKSQNDMVSSVEAIQRSIDEAIRHSSGGPPVASEAKQRDIPQRGVISFVSSSGGQGLEGFFDTGGTDNHPDDSLSPEFDDSSVAIFAGDLQRRNLDSQLTESWMQGDTIENFMGWADQAIKASDTESVRKFEISRDLNDPNDFDDESTIATYQDDASIVSWNTPSRNTSYASFENLEGAFEVAPPFEVDTKPMATPAKIAASILYSDSPANSKELTHGISNLVDENDQDIINMGLSFPANDFGLDAGLSFAVDDAGFDDGLGFGDNSMSFGANQEDFSVFDDSTSQSRPEPKSPERKGWFSWRK